MTLQDEYTTTTASFARQAQDAFTTAADNWNESLQKMTNQVAPIVPVAPVLPAEVPTAFVEQWIDFTERVTKVNSKYVINLTNALNAMSGAVRQHIDGLSDAMRDQSQAVTNTAKSTIDSVVRAETDAIEKTERLEREAVERAEQEERDRVRAERAAERAKVREARKDAREKYEGHTKAELSELLASRDLPKTGNVDELIERLVDADTK